MKQVLKNHVSILIDRSGSMYGLLDKVVEVFNNQINYLRTSSLSFEQETRVSVYIFDDVVENLVFDVDVARPMELGKISDGGCTSLMDAVGLSIEDMQLLPQKYGDHSFITYLLTDGLENTSRKYTTTQFSKMINNLPENFSIVAFAPNNNAIRSLENLGFPKGNIDKWDNTAIGVEEVGRRFEQTMNNFYRNREVGIRSSSTIFSDLNKVSVNDVKSVADEVSKFDILINEDVKAVHIKPMVEEKLGIDYTMGCAFYELVKNEHIQEKKEIAVQDKKTGKVYKGYRARAILNLPNSGKVKISPVDNKKWIVYVQSTSVNRNVIPKQRVLVIR